MPSAGGAADSEVRVTLGSAVAVATNTGVGVNTGTCSTGVGNMLMTNPMAILSTMIRLITYRAICDAERRRLVDLLLPFRRAMVLLPWDERTRSIEMSVREEIIPRWWGDARHGVFLVGANWLEMVRNY